jgi:hypothetical protein
VAQVARLVELRGLVLPQEGATIAAPELQQAQAWAK